MVELIRASEIPEKKLPLHSSAATCKTCGEVYLKQLGKACKCGEPQIKPTKKQGNAPEEDAKTAARPETGAASKRTTKSTKGSAAPTKRKYTRRKTS